MPVIFRLFLMFFLLNANLWAGAASSSWYTQDTHKKTMINVELFLSSTCPHCHKADDFFRSIEPQTPWLHVQRYLINEDKSALIHFNQLLNDQQLNDFAVPSVFFCNSRWAGFSSAETTGKDLLHALNYCKKQIETNGKLTGSTVATLKRWANANRFDSGMIEAPSTAHYIISMALVDAFNPCSLFCLIAFFALIFMQDRTLACIIVGTVYILTLGIMHYIQQAYASVFYEWLPLMRWPSILIGLFILYLMGQHYRKNSTPLLFIAPTFLLSIIIQMYQQTCLMNWSFIFEQWLSHQNSSNSLVMLYQLTYQFFYLVPLISTLCILIFLLRTERFRRLKPVLNTIGLLYILAIGLLLILYPGALSSLTLSLLVLALIPVLSLILSALKK